MKIIQFMGGLGNQMFQYVFYKYIEKNNEVFADLSLYEKYKAHNGYELEKIFGIKLNTITKEQLDEFFYVKDNSNFLKRLVKKILRYKKTADWKIMKDFINEMIVLNNHNTNDVYYSGYWQNFYYANEFKDDVKNLFCFPELDVKNAEVKNLIDKCESCSIHVRRGDYLKETVFSNVSLNYYNNAIKIMLEKNTDMNFFVFSDDLKWCKENLSIQKNVFFVENNFGADSYKDMQLMSCCDNHIIPNSTFSWWGAFLSKKSGITICPKNWYNFTDFNALICDNWMPLDNE